MHVYVRFTKLVIILRVATYDLRQVTSPIMEVKRYIVSYILYKMIEYKVINATFSNILAISWRPVLVVEEAGENHRPRASNW